MAGHLVEVLRWFEALGELLPSGPEGTGTELLRRIAYRCRDESRGICSKICGEQRRLQFRAEVLKDLCVIEASRKLRRRLHHQLRRLDHSLAGDEQAEQQAAPERLREPFGLTKGGADTVVPDDPRVAPSAALGQCAADAIKVRVRQLSQVDLSEVVSDLVLVEDARNKKLDEPSRARPVHFTEPLEHPTAPKHGGVCRDRGMLAVHRGRCRPTVTRACLVAHRSDLQDQLSDALEHRTERLLNGTAAAGGAVQAPVDGGQELAHVLPIGAFAASNENDLRHALDQILGGAQDRRVVTLAERRAQPLLRVGNRQPPVLVDALGATEIEPSLHWDEARRAEGGPDLVLTVQGEPESG